MKNLILTFILSFSLFAVTVHAEPPISLNVNTDNSNFTINSVQFTENSTGEDIIKLLGKPERLEEIGGKEVIYAFDELGIAITLNPSLKTIKLLSITYLYDGDKKVAKESFKGKLSINGEEVTDQSTYEQIAKISKLNFGKVMEGFYLSQKHPLNLMIYYPENGKTLGQFGVILGK